MRQRKTQKRKTGFCIRILTPEYAGLYCKISNDEAIFKYTSFFGASNIDSARSIIKANTTHYCKIYGLFNKANRLVAVYTVETYPDITDASVCYMVGQKYRGKGYASIGIKLLCKEVQQGCSSFIFSINKSNTASIRVQEKLGSVLEGASTKYFNYRFTF